MLLCNGEMRQRGKKRERERGVGKREREREIVYQTVRLEIYAGPSSLPSLQQKAKQRLVRSELKKLTL